MKIFGIGLEKTGTTTLGKALQILGFNDHKGFDLDLLKEIKSGNIDAALEAAQAFNNFENYPWPLIYQEAYNHFPDSKFILTTRTTPLRWFNSLTHNARRTGPQEARQLVYGHSMPNLFEEEDVQFYKDHLNSVTSFFKANDDSRLLSICWAHEEGWAPLCNFLGVDVPDVEFPHLNR